MDATTRKTNLRALIARRFGDVPANAAAAMGLSKGRVSQLLSEGGQFGERAARGIELKLGMAPHALDRPVTPAGNAGGDHEPAHDLPAPTATPASLAQALEVLGMALAADMPDDVRQDAADLLAKLAHRRGAARHQEELLALLRADLAKLRHAA